MGHRQDMTPEQRLKWDSENYKRMLEAKRGHNYQYWNERHDKMLENGWKIFIIAQESTRQWNNVFDRHSTTSEDHAKKFAEKLRTENNCVRIVCGYVKTKQRDKRYTILFKPKQIKETPRQIENDEWFYKGCIIQKQIKHPQLSGCYEVFKNNKEQSDIGRAFTFAQAKKLCEANASTDEYYKF